VHTFRKMQIAKGYKLSNIDYWREYLVEKCQRQQDQCRPHDASREKQKRDLLKYFTKCVANSPNKRLRVWEVGWDSTESLPRQIEYPELCRVGG
jgi:hypothetical protein